MNTPGLTMHNRSILSDIAGWLIGIIFMAIGVINIFWGNDTGYGIFIFLLSFLYFPPVASLIKKIFGRSIPLAVKIITGVFIVWTALGVAELFDKINLMLKDF